MPTVPTTFVPQVAPSGGGDIGQFAAPGVQPMENLAARQQEAFGRATEQAGLVAYRVGSAIQDDIDEATAKQGDVQSLQAFSQVESEYSQLLGQDADKGYEAAVGRLGEIAAKAMDGLQNDTQRMMLEPVISRNMMNVQSRLTQHRNGESRRFALNESKARSDVYVGAAVQAFGQVGRVDAAGNPVGRVQFEADKGIALEEARKAARLAGIPDGSAQMKLVERDVNDRIATGIVDQLVASRQYGQAEEYLSVQEKSVDPTVRDTLMKRIEANRGAVVVEELTASIIASGRPEAQSDPGTYPSKEDAEPKPPQTLRDALLAADSIEDPMTRKAVRANLESTYSRRDALVEAEYSKLQEDAANVFAVEGRVTSEMLAQMEPKDRAKWMTLTIAKDEDHLMMQVADNPRMLTKSFLADALKNGKMSGPTYTRLMAELNKPDAPQRIFEASVDADRLNTTLYDNGMADLVSPSKSDTANVERKTRLQNVIKGRIEAEQNRLQRKMSDKETQGIIDRAIIEMGTTVQEDAGWFWFDKTAELPISMMTPQEMAGVTGRFLKIGNVKIPSGEYEAIYSDLSSTGRVPTSRQVLEYYMRTKGQQ